MVALLLLARTDSKGAGDNDIWILRLDGSGDIVWDKTYGGIGHDLTGMVL